MAERAKPGGKQPRMGGQGHGIDRPGRNTAENGYVKVRNTFGDGREDTNLIRGARPTSG
jgi:hypothetical protein